MVSSRAAGHKYSLLSRVQFREQTPANKAREIAQEGEASKIVENIWTFIVRSERGCLGVF